MKCLTLLLILVGVHALFAQQNPVPGWDFMFAGYDIRNASSKSYVDGIKYPIFVPSYTMHQTVKLPGSNIVYDVPDQMYAYDVDETDVQTSTDIFQDVTEMLTEETQSFSFSIGFNVKVFGITATYNRTSGYIHYIFNENDKFAAKGHLDSKTTKFVLGPYPLFTLSPFFDMLINTKIPQCPKSAADLENVALLIQTWGHVFPTEIFMGGRFDCVTSLDQSLVKKYDKSWVITQLSLKFTYDGFDLYTGGFKNRTDIKIDNIFSQASKTSLFFVGGEHDLQTNETEKPWFKSIDDNPGLIEASFSPLSNLVTDPVKQRNLLYMITNHINTGLISAPPCAAEHLTDTGLQLNPIPGSDFVGAGYDSLTMSLKGQVIDHTYTSGHSWTNPFYPTYSYAVADTLYVWDQTDHFEENFTSIAMTDSDFKVQLSSQVSGSDFLGFGSHSSQMYVYQYYHEFHECDQSMNTRSITWFDLELSPIVQVDPMAFMNTYAKEVFSGLGTNINDPAVKQKYWQALEFYGDSLVRRVSVGGSLYYQGFLDNNTVNQVTIEHFHQQSSWSFFGIFGGKSSWDYYNKVASALVKENEIVEIQVNGGTWDPQAFPFLHKTTTGSYNFVLKNVTGPVISWDDFVLTIKDNMVPVHYEIVPMYTIFSDPVISNNFRIVTQEYLASRMKKKGI